MPLHLLWRLFRARSPWPPIFLELAARSCGARVRLSGARPARDCFLVSNHVSWIDILALGGATGTAFISKDDVAGWPMIGWLAAQNNTIFIARDRRHGVAEQLESLRRAMDGHQPITLFAEGTTGNGHTLLPFKPALFAVMSPPPRAMLVQPVFIDYGPAAKEIAWHGNEGSAGNAARVLARKGRLDVTIHLLEPFDPATLPDRKALANEARNRIAACLPPFMDVAAPV
ncbi:lysophospholipid acyltransferase family protein [Sphingobium sp. H39-3-25]|uniref:lysophospholipid acyltransferase family protein n=1 Tax=Sphingobium arseniciresistens TaxID=3030834 RepID=UPI0023B8B5FD|nr:lysophospholipid acyltransferase family protein [Sphingobium arseniciresistens]